MPFLTALIPLIGPIVDKLVDRIPDPAAKEKAKAEAEAAIIAAVNQASQEQNEINKIEAANPNVFVSGWRPFIGWVCGAGIAWHYLGAPFAGWIMSLLEVHAELPNVPTGDLMELVMAMLGLGGLRTFEKLKGVAAK